MIRFFILSVNVIRVEVDDLDDLDVCYNPAVANPVLGTLRFSNFPVVSLGVIKK